MVLSLLLSTLLEFLALLCLYPLGINTIPAGPNTFLFSLLHQHIRLVPSSYDLRVFGVPMTDKFFIYAPAFQVSAQSNLLCCRCKSTQMGLRSRSMVVVAAIGTLTGHLYRSELADLKQYRLPPALVRFSKIHLLPAMGSLQPPIRTLIALPTRITRPPRTAAATPAEGSTPADEGPITTARSLPAPGADTTNTGPSMMRQWVDELTGRAQNAEAGLRVPSEAEVTHVTSMFPGLGREVIVAALQRRCVSVLSLPRVSGINGSAALTSRLLWRR
jgi:hypothetical protein